MRKLRLFIDEVGNGDLKGAARDPNVRYLSLTGIIAFRDHHEQRFCPAIEGVKTDILGASPANPIVLHRRDIMRREGPFAVLRDEGLRQAFDTRLLDLILTLPYLAVTVTIDKKQHLEKYGVWHFDPYHYCLRCLVERYINYLYRHSFRGDVVIEARNKHSDKRVKASFQRIYETGTEHVPASIVQQCLLSHDIKFFPKSANIVGIHLADILAHPSFRAMRLQRDQLPEPGDYGTKVVNILTRRRYARDPRSRKIDGWGRKWLP